MTQEWRQTERPAGLQDYQRWFRPEGLPRGYNLSDIDGLLHTRNQPATSAGRFLMVEFKPSLDGLTTGQRITLEHFSRLPGCSGLVIQDTHWDDRSGEKMPDTEETLVQVWVGGEHRIYSCSILRLNQSLTGWYRNEDFLVKHPEPEPKKVVHEFMLPGPRTREEMFKNLP